jgi:thiol-disulfide isomerase/thioredoxin
MVKATALLHYKQNMKNILLLSLLAIGIIAFTSKNAQEFTVIYVPGSTGSVSSVVIGYYENGKLVQNRGKLENGSYIIKGTIPGIKKGEIALFKNMEKGFTLKVIKFILEPGTITIKEEDNGLLFSGTPLQKEFTRFTNSTGEIAEKIKDKGKLLAGYEKAGDAANSQKIEAELAALNRQQEKQWEKYFDAKTNPLVTAFALENYVTEEWTNLEKANKYYNDLPATVKSLNDIKWFGDKLNKTLALNPGNKCPDFSLPDQSGKMVDTRKFKNKYLLIDFWASWCGPCRAEGPNLVALYKKYNANGFEILQVSFDKDKAAWLKAVQQDQYTWTNIVDTAGMTDSKIAGLFNITSIPKNLLLDRNGVIIARNIKGDALNKKMAELLGKKEVSFTIE